VQKGIKEITVKTASSGMLRHVALVRTDVSEDRIAFIIRVTRIGELGITLGVTNSLILFTLMMEAIRSSETLVPSRVTRCHIAEAAIRRMYIFICGLFISMCHKV
jgi:hypothetical protein